MFRLALQTLRYRIANFLGVFTAIFGGVAIVMACAGLVETGIRLNAPPERLNTPIVVSKNYDTTERARLDSEISKKIAHTSGVASVIPDVSFAAELAGFSASREGLFGHPWASAALAPYSLTAGSQPKAEEEVVVDSKTAAQAKLAPGSRVDVTVKGQSRSFTVSGIAESAASYTKPAFFFADNYALSQTENDLVDTYGVIPADGTFVEALQHELEVALAADTVRVLSGDDRGLAEFAGIDEAQSVLIAGSSPFGGNTIVVVVLVVSSLLGLSIRQRTREMALLQTIGATPWQVRRLVISEAMLIAILAVALAIIPSYWLGEFMLQGLKASGLVPEQVLYYPGFIPTIIGVGVGVLSAFGASLMASRHATKVQPIEALAELTIQRRWFNWIRLVFAIIGLLGGLALAIVTALVMRGSVASSTAGPAVLPWLLAAGLLAPALVLPGIMLLAKPLETLFKRATGYLAAKNLRVRYLQSASIVTPIMLASAMSLSMLYQQTTLTNMAERAYLQDLRIDAVVQSQGNGITDETVQAIGSVHGVTASTPLISSTGHFIDKDGTASEDAFALRGVAYQTGQAILDYNVTSGSLKQLEGDTIALPTQTAASLKRKVGDTLTLRLGDGRDKTVSLIALFEAPHGFEHGVMPADTLLPHTTSGLMASIALQLQPSLSADKLHQELSGIKDIGQVAVLDNAALVQGSRNEASVLSWVNTLFTIMVMLYAILFLINTVVISFVARRREFALQQLIGSTRREVLGMVTLEAASLSFIGVTLGAVVSSVALVPFSIAIHGSPFPSGPWTILAAIALGVTLVTILVTLGATLYAMQTRPIKAVASKE